MAAAVKEPLAPATFGYGLVALLVWLAPFLPAHVFVRYTLRALLWLSAVALIAWASLAGLLFS